MLAGGDVAGFGLSVGFLAVFSWPDLAAFGRFWPDMAGFSLGDFFVGFSP